MRRVFFSRSLSSLDQLHAYKHAQNFTATNRLYDSLEPITCPTLASEFMQAFATSGSTRRTIQIYESLYGLGIEMTSLKAHWVVGAFIAAGDVKKGSDYFLGMFGVAGMGSENMVPMAETYAVLMDAYLDERDVKSFKELVKDMDQRCVVMDGEALAKLKHSASIITETWGHEQTISDYIESGCFIMASKELGDCLKSGQVPSSRSIASVFCAVHKKSGWHNAFMTFKRQFRPALTCKLSARSGRAERNIRRSSRDSASLEEFMMQCLVLLHTNRSSDYFRQDGVFYECARDLLEPDYLQLWTNTSAEKLSMPSHNTIDENIHLDRIQRGNQSIREFLNESSRIIPLTNLSDYPDRGFLDYVYVLIRMSELKGYWMLRATICEDLGKAGILFDNAMYVKSFLRPKLQ